MTQYLAFDVGGTNLKYALLNNSGEIIEKDKTSTPTDNINNFMAKIYEIADKYVGKFEGIAICAPGKVDVQKGIVYFGGALPFLDQTNFKELLENRYHIPVGVENDGKAAGLAELWLGELKGIDNGMAVVLGTGIGGGLILNGKLVRGSHFQADELSFMHTDSSKYGFESFVCDKGSAVSMVKKVNQAVGNQDVKDGLVAFDAIKEQNPAAVKIFKRMCREIAVLITNIQAVADLDKIVIGGGISAQPIVVEEINRQYDQLVDEVEFVKKMLTKPEIVRARFMNDANIYGALYALLLQINHEKY